MEFIMTLILQNYTNLNNQDGKIYGRNTVVTTVNPYNTYFIATYPDGSVIKGTGLLKTGWDDIPNGLCKLEYFLSTGHLITIPLYRAYKPLIDCSVGMDRSRVFHSINVQCLDFNSIVIDKIILKEDWYSKYKIGDRVVSRTPIVPDTLDKSWKFTTT